MAKGNEMMTYWIERETGEMRSHHFDRLPNNGSYRAEVMIAHAIDPIDIVEIPDSMLSHYQTTLSDMRAESVRLTKEIADAKKTGLISPTNFTTRCCEVCCEVPDESGEVRIQHCGI